ncbi:MAG: fumarate hydratase, partial [Candidatus Lokiarchaeota archaeon]|nr:fumarate hydratase [Candidatus Lokiarchaeota archaeon]
PICQDTGVLNFYVNLGNRFPIISNFQKIIHEAVEKATTEVPLRGNSVDPISNLNPENNLGVNVPPIHINIVDNSSDLEIFVLPKGGGGENLSKLFMLNPSNGLDIFQEKIVQALKEAGGMPCPPVILGVGLGGDASNSMTLAKNALLRPLNQRHPRTDVAKIELELINKINKLNIGVMGLGGKFTCLDVHIEIAMRHPASFPVGMIVQCYCHRIASFKINQKGMMVNET